MKMQVSPQTLTMEPNFSWVAIEGSRNKLKHGHVSSLFHCDDGQVLHQGVDPPSLEVLGYPILALRDAAVRQELDTPQRDLQPQPFWAAVTTGRW